MARTIDYVIEYIRDLDGMSPVAKQIAIARLDRPPTAEEIELAKLRVYGERKLTENDAPKLEQIGLDRPVIERMISEATGHDYHFHGLRPCTETHV